LQKWKKQKKKCKIEIKRDICNNPKRIIGFVLKKVVIYVDQINLSHVKLICNDELGRRNVLEERTMKMRMSKEREEE
jgi:hypothetical protein